MAVGPSRRRPDTPPTLPARAVALRLLTRRDYTTAELHERLTRRGYEAPDVQAAIERLAGDGLLNDRRVALAHVRTASAVKGRGRLRITRELEARGIDRALARELTAGLSGEDEANAIERFLQRKRLPKRLGIADRQRLFQQLMRRGFPAEAITKALRKHGSDEED